VFNFLFVLS